MHRETIHRFVQRVEFRLFHRSRRPLVVRNCSAMWSHGNASRRLTSGGTGIFRLSRNRCRRCDSAADLTVVILALVQSAARLLAERGGRRLPVRRRPVDLHRVMTGRFKKSHALQTISVEWRGVVVDRSAMLQHFHWNCMKVSERKTTAVAIK